MSNESCMPLVIALDDASATLEQVGGKGASLARLAAAGLPVPPGFHVTTAAYRCFVTEHNLKRLEGEEYKLSCSAGPLQKRGPAGILLLRSERKELFHPRCIPC